MTGSDGNVREGNAPFGDYQTWYRVTGSLDAAKLPVVVLHGGPGATHDYLDAIKHLAVRGRAVVHYDQLGNGRSTRLPGKGADFWTVALFLAELDNLLRHLGIQNAYHVVGQSWGGMLGAEHAVRQPAGLKSIVIADSPASMQLWLSEAARLRGELPQDVQDTLLRHEADGSYGAPDYVAATRVFYDRHVCRVPWPPEVARSFAAIDADPTVYHTMNGPTEFHTIGTLKNWSVIDRLHLVQAPTLLVSGRYDEATPATVQPYADRIAGAKWEMFEHSSHLPHVEETERWLEVVGDFLDQHDS